MDKEKWRTIPSNPLYEASDKGRIRRAVGGQGCRAGKVLVPYISGGRETVGLYQSCIRKHKKVHSLVAEAFIGPRPKGLQVNHKDGCKYNNSATNLEYITQLDNIEHANKLGIAARGERVNSAKNTREDVLSIRSSLEEGIRQSDIARDHSVSAATIRDIKNRRTWAWL